MELENTVLLVEFLFLVFVDVGYLREKLPSMLTHLNFKMFLGSIKASIFNVLSLCVLCRPFFLKVLSQNFYSGKYTGYNLSEYTNKIDREVTTTYHRTFLRETGRTAPVSWQHSPQPTLLPSSAPY